MNVPSVKWFHLFSVYLCLHSDDEPIKIELLCNDILGFLSWLEAPVPTSTGTALFFPCHFRTALLWSNFTSSSAELPFPFIGFPKSESRWAQGNVPVVCTGTELPCALFRGWMLSLHSPSSLELTLLVPKHHEIKLQPGRVTSIPAQRARSGVHRGFIMCLDMC